MNKKLMLVLVAWMATLTAWAGTFQVISAHSLDGIHVGVSFNDAVDPATGNDSFQYDDGGAAGGVTAAFVRTNTASYPNKARTVYLTLAGAAPASFTLTVGAQPGGVKNASLSDSVTASVLVTVENWNVVDVGCNPQGVAFSSAPGQFEIEAGGADVWDDTDAKLLYQQKSGNFDVMVQVTKEELNSNRAGLIVRQDTTVRPLEVSELTHSSGLEGSFRRLTIGGGMGWLSPIANWTGVTFPNTWARIQRIGDNFTCYQSLDGLHWTFDGTVNIAMTDPVLVGLVHNIGQCNNTANGPSMATFANYQNFDCSQNVLTIKTQPANATVDAAHTATFSVDAAAFNGATDLGNGGIAYQWQSKCPGDPVFSDIAGAASSSYTTGLLNPSTDNQCQYRVQLTFGLCPGATSAAATLTVNPDVTPPQIVSASGVASGSSDSVTIAVCYNELMSPDSIGGAGDSFNYTVTGPTSPNAQVPAAELLPDLTTVLVHVTGLTDNTFTMTVSGEPDFSGNPLASMTVSGSIYRGPTTVDIGVATTPGEAYTCAPGSVILSSSGGSVRSGSDRMTFSYDTISGDFDKKIQISSIIGTADWSRGGLMVRESLDPQSACMKILASNPGPGGANAIAIWGRATNTMSYTDWGRRYGGVTNAIPNQWLRMRRVGNSFSYFVGTNGVNWSLVAENWNEMVPDVLLGYFAGANGASDTARVQFSNYSDTGCTDSSPLTLVSAGTLDHTIIGVKFSKQLDSATAQNILNYGIAGTLVTNAAVGIGGNTVYLTVDPPLAADAFTVIVNNVKDACGNVIAAASSVSGKRSPWNSTDIGYIQAFPTRGTPGDDPGRVGQAVAVSSDADPEIEIVGGGSNAWNPGDYVHYLWNDKTLVGDFDVWASVDRNDEPVVNGSYGNSGLMLRAALWRAGMEGSIEGTKVAMVANTTYFESGQNRSAIALWRQTDGAGYDNGNPQGAYGTVINGIGGYYSGLNAIDASGNVDPKSSPTSKRYLRIKRRGADFTFYNSFDGIVWNAFETHNIPSLPNELVFGYSTMNDTGGGAPPNNAYGGNTTPYQNQFDYSVQRVRIGLTLIVSITYDGTSGQLSWQGTGKLQIAPTITGPWTDAPNQASPQTVVVPFFNVKLDGAQDATTSPGTGSGSITLSGNTLTFNNITYSGLSANSIAAHIHGPAAPGVAAAVLYPLAPAYTTLGSTSGSFNGTLTLTAGTGGFTIAQQLQQLESGQWYINVHTDPHPGGEIRGQILTGAEFFRLKN